MYLTLRNMQSAGGKTPQRPVVAPFAGCNTQIHILCHDSYIVLECKVTAFPHFLINFVPKISKRTITQ